MNRIAVSALLAAATMFPLASSLVAEPQLNVNVPFAFSVANRYLPAGQYRIERHGAFLTLDNQEDHRMVTLVANPGELSEDGRSYLSFDEVNGVRFLRRVATPHEQSSVELTASKDQKHAEQGEHQQVPMDVMQP
ncbi:hypothetical protein [Occallatibacter riparius]|uniref:Gel scht n=1 Tax=Occallatibacter riparius TaxID=1002689 RepID=A0A9J7BNG8_9BACT|nr:hypothetical protein [Occallatibacter riparius]UWZ84436.1 hypothetical protein MOP44_00535 [Occallatibacter riparius]